VGSAIVANATIVANDGSVISGALVSLLFGSPTGVINTVPATETGQSGVYTGQWTAGISGAWNVSASVLFNDRVSTLRAVSVTVTQSGALGICLVCR
jgi:hypothetical protein